MSSLSIKKSIIYLCYYDRIAKKQKCRSLKMKESKRNLQKAKQIQKEFDEQRERELAKQYRCKNKLGKDNTLKEAIERFYEINSNKSPKTIKTYNYFFGKFIDGVHFKKDQNLGVVNKSKVEQWILSLSKQGYGGHTLYGLTKNLKKFVKFLQEYGYIENFRINSELIYKMPDSEIIIFSKEDIELMLEKVKEKSVGFQRLFYLLLYTGLRPSDLLDTKVKDLDLEELTLKYYSSKTGKYNQVAIMEKLVTVLEPLMKDKQPDDKLIDYVDVHNIGRAFRKFLKDIGLDNKSYTLRTFRKTFISMAYESGVDYVTLSRIVGHSNLKTTMKYYTKFSLSKQHDELKKMEFLSDPANENPSGKEVGKTRSKTKSHLKLVA